GAGRTPAAFVAGNARGWRRKARSRADRRPTGRQQWVGPPRRSRRHVGFVCFSWDVSLVEKACAKRFAAGAGFIFLTSKCPRGTFQYRRVVVHGTSAAVQLPPNQFGERDGVAHRVSFLF